MLDGAGDTHRMTPLGIDGKGQGAVGQGIGDGAVGDAKPLTMLLVWPCGMCIGGGSPSSMPNHWLILSVSIIRATMGCITFFSWEEELGQMHLNVRRAQTIRHLNALHAVLPNADTMVVVGASDMVFSCPIRSPVHCVLRGAMPLARICRTPRAKINGGPGRAQ